MVRPILEYACTVQSPYTHVNKHKIEIVQHRAAHFIMNRYSQMASVTEMLNKLNLPLLSCRRDNMKLITLYKLINHYISIPNNDLTLIHNPTRGHPYRYARPLSRVDCHLHSFFASSIKMWNNLPVNVIETTSLERFKQLINFL